MVKYNTEYTLPDNLKPALMRQEVGLLRVVVSKF